MPGSILRTVRDIGPKIFNFAVFLALLTFVQGQELALEIQMDHQTKIMKISNWSLAPLYVNIYTILFKLNPGLDANGIPHLSEMKIEQYYTRGFVLHYGNMWPEGSRSVDLKTNQMLHFQNWRAHQNIDERVYCFAVEGRSWLSNKKSIEAILTPGTLFAASLFGPMSAASGSGGGYEALRAGLALESILRKSCLDIYDKVR